MYLFDTDVKSAIRRELETGEYSGICTMLGFGYEYWVDCAVSIAYGSVAVSSLLPYSPELHDLYAAAGVVDRSDRLVADGVVLPSVGVSTMGVAAWPCPPVITIDTTGDGSLSCTYSGSEMLAPYSDGGDVLHVKWPEETGITGALVKDGDWPVEVVSRPVYPVKFVISLAKSDERVYTLLTETGYDAAFLQETDPYEQLAVLVLALYRHSTRERR